MGFFDFIFGKKQTEEKNKVLHAPTNRSTAISPVEEVVIACIQDMKSRNKLSILNLEPEAINLAAYLYLRGNKSIDFKLDFLPDGLIEKTRANDYFESDKVFAFFVKHSDGLYNNQHADFGKRGYRLNINLDKTIDQTLRHHFHKIHDVVIPKKEIKKTSHSTEADAVDLGLPSGNLWASKNIGASSEYDNGTYFAWGETSEKDEYGWESFLHADGSYSTMKKYCNESKYGDVDNKFVLEDADDAAQVILGSKWHTPSSEDLQELIDNCEWEWKSRNGMYGWEIMGSNGNSIFLPAAGAYSAYRLANVNESGRYWCSNMESTHFAFGLRFNNMTYNIVADTKFYGRPIRPVYGNRDQVSKTKKHSEIKTTLNPHKKISVNKLIERVNDDVSDIGIDKIVNAILIILDIDTDTILGLDIDDKKDIYETYCKMNSICISELRSKDTPSFNQQCDKLAGVYAYSKIQDEDIPENCKFAYAIGAESMWRTFDWNYTVDYCHINIENERKEYKDKTIDEVKSFVKEAVADLDFSNAEKEYFKKGALSLVDYKLTGLTAYVFLTKTFPHIF